MTGDERCRWGGSDQPRMLVDRHRDECENPGCAGCQPCTRSHCRDCGHEHAASVCPGCVGAVREDLAEVGRMVGALPEEAEHRGVNSEAMVLLGPTVDPESWQHHEASWLAGRAIPAGCDAKELDDLQAWLDVADNDRHPLLVLGRLEMVARDLLEHETDERVTVAAAIRYLDGQLTGLAGNEWFDWRDMAREVRGVRGHLEDVLRDGERTERSRVTCNNRECRQRPRLEKVYSATDFWHCPSCFRRYNAGDYQKAHAEQLRHAGAEKFLPQREAIATLVAQGRPERTVRKWLSPNEDDHEDVVGGYCEIRTHRVWVWWPDLWTRHVTTPTRKRAVA